MLLFGVSSAPCSFPFLSCSSTKPSKLPSLNSSFNGFKIRINTAIQTPILSPSNEMIVKMAKREVELKEIRARTTEEINEEIIDIKGELFMLRLQRSARNEFKSSEFRRMRKRVLSYVIAQVVAAILACVILKWLFNGDRPHVMLTLPAVNTDDLVVTAWEIMASFILMWVICGAASDYRAIKELSGATVGAAIFLNVLIAGQITGASMNPARSIGPAIATHNFHKLWIYIIAPVIGTTGAASLYNLLLSPNELRKNNEDCN